jgi:septal ring factor EnvC (AmiA/AmiB activator)
MELTPEERIISDNFAQNRGKLPWPTERGVIASRFGEQDLFLLFFRGQV